MCRRVAVGDRLDVVYHHAGSVCDSIASRVGTVWGQQDIVERQERVAFE